jgi:hypothetical protein
MMKKPTTAALALLTGLAGLVGSAGAASIEDVTFSARHQREGLVLPLQGVGLLRYRLVFKGYVAALYLPPDVAPEQALDDVPKRLEIEYFWAIGARDFAAAQNEGIARNVDPATLERVRPAMQEMAALYRDVQPGDRYALTYLPERGTELALNGEPLGRVGGSEFARAIFSIWLGEEPLSQSLKKQLLGIE